VLPQCRAAGGGELHEQQQELAVHVQQQQQCDPAATLELRQLQQLLFAAWSHKGSSAAACALLPYYAWATACGSSDVRVLLQHPQGLLQRLQQRHSASTAAVYLSHVLDVLALPAVAALLSQAAMASLVQQLTAARQQYEVACEARLHRAAAAAAAVAAAALAGSGLVPAAKRHSVAGMIAVVAAGKRPAKRQRCSKPAG
jgi:hypothetical protein